MTFFPPVTCGVPPRCGRSGSLCAVEAWVAGPRRGGQAGLRAIMARQTGLTHFYRNCPWNNNKYTSY